MKVIGLGWGFLTIFDKLILPHPREIDQNFYFLIESPPFAHSPPRPNGVYFDRCIKSTELVNIISCVLSSYFFPVNKIEFVKSQSSNSLHTDVVYFFFENRRARKSQPLALVANKSPAVLFSYTQARFRCRSTHVPNLTDKLSTAKEQCLNQFGMAVLVCCGKSVKFRQSLSNFCRT